LKGILDPGARVFLSGDLQKKSEIARKFIEIHEERLIGRWTTTETEWYKLMPCLAAAESMRRPFM
jgi:hypothetical protein